MYTRKFQHSERRRSNNVTSGNFANIRGGGALGPLILVLILLIGVFIGYSIIPFYYYESELEGHMEAQARRASILTDAEIRKNLMKHIRQLEIPIDSADDLRINRFNNLITIELEYSELFYVDLGPGRVYDIWEFHFNPRAEARL